MVDCVGCVGCVGLQPFAALLKMSNKQSVSLDSSVEISNKSRIIESLTLNLFSLVALSVSSDFVCVAPFSFDELLFSVDFTSSSKSSCEKSEHV